MADNQIPEHFALIVDSLLEICPTARIKASAGGSYRIILIPDRPQQTHTGLVVRLIENNGRVWARIEPDLSYPTTIAPLTPDQMIRIVRIWLESQASE